MKVCAFQGAADVKVMVNGREAGCVEITGSGDNWQEIGLDIMNPLEPERLNVRIRAERQAVRQEWVELYVK
jgi:hypothetical protein